MKKLLMFTPQKGTPPLPAFLNTLDPKLRAKSKLLARIIFTVRPDGAVLFLAPFIKTHKRNTMQALDASLKMLSQIDDGSGSIQELTINTLTEVRR